MPVCDDCGTDRPRLHKHHLKLKALGGTDADGVVFLCPNCHDDRHLEHGTVPLSEEARAKLSASLRRHYADPTNRAALSEKTHTPAAEAARSAKMKAHWRNPEWAAEVVRRQTAAKIGGKHPGQSVAMKNKWRDPDFRERVLAAKLEASARPETRAKIGAASRRTWANPATREKRIAALTGQVHKGQSEKMKALWADPEYRARILAARAAPRAKSDTA